MHLLSFAFSRAAPGASRALTSGPWPSKSAYLANGVTVRYSYELPKRPETYTVRDVCPAFFSAGKTSFFCRSSHSSAISGLTWVIVERYIVGAVCAMEEVDRLTASAVAP